MSFVDIEPEECPSETKVAVEKVMAAKNLTWKEALAYLANEVISPLVS